MRIIKRFSNIEPRFLFIILAIPYAAIMLYWTPPFQVPDEQSHFFRSYMLAEGKLLEDWLQNGTGGSIPESLVRAWDISTNKQNIRSNPQGKVDPQSMARAWALPLNRDQRIVVDVNRNRSPLPYVPQALGIRLGLFFDAGPLFLLYLGRIFAFVFYAALCFFAVGTTPVLKNTLMILALTPMSMSLACSVSHDAVTIAVSFLYMACLFKFAFETEKIEKKETAALLAFSIVLALTKPFYLWCLLVTIIPLSKYKGKTDCAIKAGSVVFAYFAAAKSWNAFKDHYYAEINTQIFNHIELFHNAVSSNNQKAGSDFGEFIALFARTVEQNAGFYLKSLVANLGWLDTSFPGWYVYLVLLAAIGVSLFGAAPQKASVGAKAKLICFSFFILFFAAAHFHVYWADGHYSCGNDAFIKGIQGRYFLPLSLLPFVALCNKGRTMERIGRYNGIVAPLVALCSMLLTISILEARYFG